MMPRFLNTMRLTQAVYETAASILVTVSTIKSFPALMTLPFVDQVYIIYDYIIYSFRLKYLKRNIIHSVRYVNVFFFLLSLNCSERAGTNCSYWRLLNIFLTPIYLCCTKNIGPISDRRWRSMNKSQCSRIHWPRSNTGKSIRSNNICWTKSYCSNQVRLLYISSYVVITIYNE